MEQSRRVEGGCGCSELSPSTAGSSTGEGSGKPFLDSLHARLLLCSARARGTRSSCWLIAIYFPCVWGEKVLCHKTLH